MRVDVLPKNDGQRDIALTTTARHDDASSSASSSTDNADVHGAHTDHHGPQGLNFDSPDQVQTRHQSAVKWVGRIGWVGKGVVYAIIGGLSCQSSYDASSSRVQGASVSPQGAFILLGSNMVGAPLLIVLAACLCSYILWRFWEGVTGQGYDAEHSRAKNFFRYRLSPMVSGAVYCAYLAFVLSLLGKMAQGKDIAGSDSGDFTSSWRYSGIGKAGLCIVGIAFLIGFLVQMDWALRGAWHTDYRRDQPRWLTRSVMAMGHLGYLGRGAVFLAVAILFFREVSEDYGSEASEEVETTVANAFNQLRENAGLRAVMWIMGVLLIIYGAFAVISSWARIFPTPPPSRRPKVRPGHEPVVYQTRGNELGTPHPITAPEGVDAAAAAYNEMEKGSAANRAHPADLLADARRVKGSGQDQAQQLHADAHFWRKASKRLNKVVPNNK